MLTWIADRLWGNPEGWRIEAHSAYLFWDKKPRYTVAAPGECSPVPRNAGWGEDRKKNYYDSLEEAAAKVPGTVLPLELHAIDDATWRPGKWNLIIKRVGSSDRYSAYASYTADGDMNQAFLHSPADLSLEEAKAWCTRVFAVFKESRDWDVQRIGS